MPSDGQRQWPLPESFTSTRSLLDALQNLSSAPEQWLFRGQEQADWSLEPSLERRNPKESIRFAEGRLLYDFKRHSRSIYGNLPEFEDIPSWLSLMRHRAVPTRLLDWTNSVYIALFFACANLTPEPKPNSAAITSSIPHAETAEGLKNHAAVWALSGRELSGAFKAKADELDPPPPGGWDLSNSEHFKRLAWYLFDDQHETEGLVAELLPRTSNERMSFQQGTFLITCNHNLSFEESLRHMMTSSDIGESQPDRHPGIERLWIRRFTFPLELREEILRHLYDMNVHAMTLFPDLDGLGRLLAHKYHLYWSTARGTS